MSTDGKTPPLLPCAPDAAELLHLARENLRLLTDLAAHYEVARLGPPVQSRAITKPLDVAEYLAPELADLAQEQLRVVLLDTKHQIVGCCLVYQGGINAVSIRLADCFREAVRVGAAALVLAHNHPSGDPTPSPEDVRLTVDVARMGALLGIDVLDHVIIGRADRHMSLREHGLFTPTVAANSTSTASTAAEAAPAGRFPTVAPVQRHAIPAVHRARPLGAPTPPERARVHRGDTITTDSGAQRKERR